MYVVTHIHHDDHITELVAEAERTVLPLADIAQIDTSASISRMIKLHQLMDTGVHQREKLARRILIR
jgi:hypothetical protein